MRSPEVSLWVFESLVFTDLDPEEVSPDLDEDELDSDPDVVDHSSLSSSAGAGCFLGLLIGATLVLGFFTGSYWLWLPSLTSEDLVWASWEPRWSCSFASGSIATLRLSAWERALGWTMPSEWAVVVVELSAWLR